MAENNKQTSTKERAKFDLDAEYEFTLYDAFLGNYKQGKEGKIWPWFRFPTNFAVTTWGVNLSEFEIGMLIRVANACGMVGSSFVTGSIVLRLCSRNGNNMLKYRALSKLEHLGILRKITIRRRGEERREEREESSVETVVCELNNNNKQTTNNNNVTCNSVNRSLVDPLLCSINTLLSTRYAAQDKSGKESAAAKLLKDRLKQGYTSEEILEVVKLKHRQWCDDAKMSKYLRASTLFQKTKFEEYYNELGKAKSDQEFVKSFF